MSDEAVAKAETDGMDTPTTLCSTQCFGCHTHVLWDRSWVARQGELRPGDGSLKDLRRTWTSSAKCSRQTIMVFYLIALVAGIAGCILIPTTLFFRGSGPGRSCDWSGSYLDLVGDCWAALVNVPATTEWFDITAMTACGVVILTATVTIFALITQRKWLVHTMGVLMMSSTVAVGICVLFIAIFVNNGSTMPPREMSRDLKQQLQDSLRLYPSDPDTKMIWDNVHSRYCCCGVDNFNDFTDSYNEPVPKTCACTDDHSSRNRPSYQCYGSPYSGYFSSTMCRDPVLIPAQNMTVAKEGCFSDLHRNMRNNYRNVLEVMWPILLAIAVVQFLVNVLGMCAASILPWTADDPGQKQETSLFFTTGEDIDVAPLI